MPEKSKMILIDQTNQYLFTSWSELKEEAKYVILRKLNKFLSPHNVRISLLIRMKLQNRDGSFVDKLTASSNDFFRYYVNNFGENIYEKMNHFPQCQVPRRDSNSKLKNSSQEIDILFDQFKVDLKTDVNIEEPHSHNNEFVASTNDVQSSASCSKNSDVIVTSEQNHTLDELKRKCKLSLDDSQQPDDNFQELLNMLGNNV
jgi:hypothetical protein